MMRFGQILAACVVLLANPLWAAPVGASPDSATAGHVPAAPTSASRLYLAPKHQLPVWDAPVAEQSQPITLASAVALLLPPEVAGLPLSSDQAVATRLVSWPAGLTRRNALSQIVPDGFALLVFDSGMVLAAGRVVTEPRPTPAGTLVPVAIPVVDAALFRVSPTDRTLRNVLARWSTEGGWSFENAFWTLPRDLPVKAADAFTADFKTSVLALLKSSEMTDMPAKPCFYTNKVLRVVSKGEKCDRTRE